MELLPVTWSLKGCDDANGNSVGVGGVEVVWQMDVSENSGTPKSSILIGFSITNHPFRGTTIVGNPQILRLLLVQKSQVC